MGKHLVLVGGGHAHLTVLLNIADFVQRGHRGTLIGPSPHHYYSGMGPGMLSGIYRPQEVRFQGKKMVEDRGGFFVEDRVIRINPDQRTLNLQSGNQIDYDVASFNTGSDVPLKSLVSAPRENIIPVKPVFNLLQARRWIIPRLKEKEMNFVVLGGGPAGLEVTANLWRLVQDNRGLARITLIAGSRLLVLPLVQLFLLSYAFSTDVRDLPLVVFDQSHSAEGRALLDAYRSADYFKIAYSVGSDAELRSLIEKGAAGVGLIIPPDYATRLLEGNAQVAFIVDGSDPSIANTALSAAQLIAQSHSTRLMVQKLRRSGVNLELQPPVEVRTTVWYNPDLISAYFMIPGVIAMILFAITAMLTATSVVREREYGTIEQLIVTPIRPWELVVGKSLPYVVLSLFAAFEVIAIGCALKRAG